MSRVGMHADGASDGVPVGVPSEAEIREQLARIETSDEFNVSDRVRAFLRYVVEEALAGRADRIKAYSIATEVFARTAEFDPVNDPVVRIEAGRLRRALERYYFVAGQADPVLIDMPKGGYLPTFRSNEQGAPAEFVAPDSKVLPVQPAAPHRRRLLWIIAALAVIGLFATALWTSGTGSFHIWSGSSVGATVPHGPLVLVRPFSSLGGGAEAELYATGLTDEVLSQLARFKELRVVGRETSLSLPVTAGASDLPSNFGVHYILEGTVKTSDDGLRVNARVLDSESAVVLWTSTYEADLASGDIVGVVVDIAGHVATAVGQPYGIVFRTDERRSTGNAPGDVTAYRCTLRFYRYRAVLSAEDHAAVRDCLERAVARHPGYGTAWAMLSFVYVDEDRFEFNPKGGEPSAIQRAVEAARRAVRLDPDNVRALQALMTALFFSGELDESFRAGEQALAINPNDTELLGALGDHLAQIGEWQRGSELIERALSLNPGHSGYYTGTLGFAAFMQHDTARAVSLIRQADLQKFPIFHVVAALIYAEAGLEEDAAESRNRFLEMRPRFFDDFEAELTRRNFTPEDRKFLTDAARNAGFPVP